MRRGKEEGLRGGEHESGDNKLHGIDTRQMGVQRYCMLTPQPRAAAPTDAAHPLSLEPLARHFGIEPRLLFKPYEVVTRRPAPARPRASLRPTPSACAMLRAFTGNSRFASNAQKCFSCSSICTERSVP